MSPVCCLVLLQIYFLYSEDFGTAKAVPYFSEICQRRCSFDASCRYYVTIKTIAGCVMSYDYNWDKNDYNAIGTNRKPQLQHTGIITALSVLVVILAVLLIIQPFGGKTDKTANDGKDISDLSVLSVEGSDAVDPAVIPDWIEQDLLPVNEYSRPGTELTGVGGVVVHYTGNPGTTAEQNRNYFKNLAETHETKASSHFIIGIDGKVIQCVPLDEISYCSNHRNIDTIAIECCHADDSGEFSEETRSSLIRLLNWLIAAYDLEEEDILRHFDVSGKECPKYYVLNPKEWSSLLSSLDFEYNRS